MSFQEFPENKDNKVIRFDMIPENSSREKLCNFSYRGIQSWEMLLGSIFTLCLQLSYQAFQVPYKELD